MADSLVLKGARDVTKKVGTGMVLLNPKSGGNTHRFPEWWNKKQRVQYAECAIFKVVLDNGVDTRLVVPLTEDTEIHIKHDGAGSFTFPYFRGVSRVALIEINGTGLYKEYQFPVISKGSILERTVAALPAGLAVGSVPTLSGTFTVGQEITLTQADFTGGNSPLSVSNKFEISANGTSGWSQVGTSSSTGSTHTYTLVAGDATKYLRGVSTVTDAGGDTLVSNSTASAQISA